MRWPWVLVAIAGVAHADWEPPATPPPNVGSPAPHRDAFAAAWRAARACLVGEPQWVANAATARAIQHALGRECAGPINAARAIAQAGIEDDAGYHLAWFDVDAGLASPGREIPRGDGEQEVDPVVDIDEAAVALGIATPTTRATIPTLANAAPFATVHGATNIQATAITEHEVGFTYEQDGKPDTIWTDGPGPDTTLALGYTSWSVATYTNGVHVGDSDGPRVAAAGFSRGSFGEGAERAVLLEYDDLKTGYTLARSHDGGRTWGAPARLVPDDADQRSEKRDFATTVDVMWNDGADTRWLRIDGPGRLAPARTLPGHVRRFCGVGDTLWTFAKDRISVVDGAAPSREIGDGARPVACARDRLLAEVDGGLGPVRKWLVACDRTHCEPRVEAVYETFADLAGSGSGIAHAHPIDPDLVAVVDGDRRTVVRVTGRLVAAVAYRGGPLVLDIAHDGTISEDPIP